MLGFPKIFIPLNDAMGQKKKMRGITAGKDVVKLSLFIDDCIPEKPTGPTKTLLPIVRGFGKMDM